MAYIVIAVCFGLAGGVIGKLKGSSFLIWFLIGAGLPLLGTIAAVCYRFERDEPRRECDECGALMPITNQVCRRCGADQEYPQQVFVRG